MSSNQHPWIGVFITALAISAAVFGALQFIQVTPLSMENTALKEKLSARSSEITNSKEYRELERAYIASKISYDSLKKSYESSESELKEAKNKIAETINIRAKLISTNSRLQEYVSAYEEQSKEILELTRKVDFTAKLESLQDEQRKIEHLLKTEVNWRGDDSKEARRLRTRTTMLQEQINIFISSKKNI